MNNIKDLNIKREILPLFNFTLNMFAKEKVLQILETPLASIDAIYKRQNVLKGFSENHNILKNYSYTVLYLNEVHYLLNDAVPKRFSQNKWKFMFFASSAEKSIYKGKLNQLVLFFHRLQTHYFTKLELNAFPEKYKRSIKEILQFFSHFDLNECEHQVRESRLNHKQIIKLSKTISTLKSDGSILAFWENLFLFEAYLSISFGISKHQLVFPSFIDKGINLKALYHPLIESPVKNDFETSSNVIVLNGPNMSGKSTFLKSIGLCMYFGHLGIGIPATTGDIPFCTDFSIQINRSDDLLNGYSHFMTEVVNLKTVVERASKGANCFAVFDELFSGTNVEDALEICTTTINGLSKYKHSYFFISTHIQELKEVSNDLVSNYHIDCKLINDQPTFTYKLKKGWSDIKVGRLLFDKQGLNDLLR